MAVWGKRAMSREGALTGEGWEEGVGMWVKETTKTKSYYVPGSVSDIGMHSVYIICVIQMTFR